MNRIIIYIICFLVGVILFVLLHNINTLDQRDLAYPSPVPGDGTFIVNRHIVQVDPSKIYLLSLYFTQYEYKRSSRFTDQYWLANIRRSVRYSYEVKDFSFPRLKSLIWGSQHIINEFTSTWRFFIYTVFGSIFKHPAIYTELLGILSKMSREVIPRSIIIDGTEFHAAVETFGGTVMSTNTRNPKNVAFITAHDIFSYLRKEIEDIYNTGRKIDKLRKSISWLTDEIIQRIKNCLLAHYSQFIEEDFGFGKNMFSPFSWTGTDFDDELQMLPCDYMTHNPLVAALLYYTMDVVKIWIGQFHNQSVPPEEGIFHSILPNKTWRTLSQLFVTQSYIPNRSTQEGRSSSRYAFKLTPMYEFHQLNSDIDWMNRYLLGIRNQFPWDIPVTSDNLTGQELFVSRSMEQRGHSIIFSAVQIARTRAYSLLQDYLIMPIDSLKGIARKINSSNDDQRVTEISNFIISHFIKVYLYLLTLQTSTSDGTVVDQLIQIARGSNIVGSEFDSLSDRTNALDEEDRKNRLIELILQYHQDVDVSRYRILTFNQTRYPKYQLQYTDWQSMIRLYSLLLFKWNEAGRTFPKPILLSKQPGNKYPDEFTADKDIPPVNIHKIGTSGECFAISANRTGLYNDPTFTYNTAYLDRKKRIKRDETKENVSVIGLIQTGINATKFRRADYPFLVHLYPAVKGWEGLEIVYEDTAITTGTDRKLYSYGYHPDLEKCVRYSEFYKEALGLNITDSDNIVIFQAIHGKHGYRYPLRLSTEEVQMRRSNHNISRMPFGYWDANDYYEYIKSEIGKCTWWQQPALPFLLELELYLFCQAERKVDVNTMLSNQIAATLNIRQSVPDLELRLPPSQIAMLKQIIDTILRTPEGVPPDRGDLEPEPEFEGESIIKKEAVLLLMGLFNNKIYIDNIKKRESEKCHVNYPPVPPLPPSVVVDRTHEQTQNPRNPPNPPNPQNPAILNPYVGSFQETSNPSYMTCVLGSPLLPSISR